MMSEQHKSEPIRMKRPTPSALPPLGGFFAITGNGKGNRQWVPIIYED